MPVRRRHNYVQRLKFECLEQRLVLANASPFAPTVNQPVADNDIVNPFDVHMEAGPFIDPDVGDTHSASEWEIWTNAGEIERIWSSTQIGTVEMVHLHLGDGTFLNSHDGRVDLVASDGLPIARSFSRQQRRRGNSLERLSVRNFTTAPLSQTFPLETEDIISLPPVAWTDTFGKNILLPSGSPAPSIALESATGELLLRIDGSDGTTNSLTNPEELPDHIDVRLRIRRATRFCFCRNRIFRLRTTTANALPFTYPPCPECWHRRPFLDLTERKHV